MLKSVIDLIRKPKATTTDLQAALSQLSTQEAEQRVSQLEAERRRILLDGTDKELTAIEEQISAACRDLERTQATIEELQRRIAETEAREKADAFAAERKAIEDEAQAAADALRKEYPTLSRQLVALLDRVRRANEAASALNRHIMTKRHNDAAAHGLRVAPVESRVFAGFQEGLSASLAGQTLIVGVQGFAPGWNDQNVQMFSIPLKVA